MGPRDTLHSILRAVGSGGRDFNQGDNKVRFGFRTFWIGKGPLFQVPMCQELSGSLDYVCVGGAGSERDSWRRWSTQHRKAAKEPVQVFTGGDSPGKGGAAHIPASSSVSCPNSPWMVTW